jgi:hypothetical protein
VVALLHQKGSQWRLRIAQWVAKGFAEARLSTTYKPLLYYIQTLKKIMTKSVANNATGTQPVQKPLVAMQNFYKNYCDKCNGARTCDARHL